MKELSIEQKVQRYDEAIERARKEYKNHESFKGFCEMLVHIFPELKESEESEDERIRYYLINFIKINDGINLPPDDAKKALAWLEKQGKHANFLSKIQVGDKVIRNEDGELVNLSQLNRVAKKDKNQGQTYTKKDVDDAYLKGVTDTKNEIEKQYEATYQIRKDIATFILNYRGDIKDRAKWVDYLGIKVFFVEKQGKKETLCDKCRKEHPSHSCQDITALGRCIVELEQKSVEWEPQTGDTFRKKGTTSPTYHLCGKREDSITFVFVENREVGISGGEISTFTLKQDYELVERPKPIEKVVEEEFNKALQTKVEQKPVKNKGTNLKEEEMTPFQKKVFYIIDTNIEAEVGLKQECDILLALASNEIKQKPTWSEEDKNAIQVLKDIVKHSNEIDENIYTISLKEKLYDWLKSVKDRVQLPLKQEWIV